jgi:serine/threonine protein kinase/tetratricopeptide (TPR) repeat protein
MIVLPPSETTAASQPGESVDPRLPFQRSLVLEELTSAWERGEQPQLETYLERLSPLDHDGAVELIYRHFCLVEAAGGEPDPDAYRARFPAYDDALDRVLRLHAECPLSLLDRWVRAGCVSAELPEAGDSIGPFSLRRELGRGSFARVFLASQTDLEDRLVVIKVSTRMTREPWLMARVRHAHIVEIFSHATVDDGALQLICMPFWGGATLAAVLAAGRQRRIRPALGSDLLADLDRVAAPEYPRDNPSQLAREILSRLTYAQAVAWIIARLAEALDCAFHRGVVHGDVKPSNILLSADGNPMILDFNLARDWATNGPHADLADRGGTLAYMAPERLRDLARIDQTTQGGGMFDAHPEPLSSSSADVFQPETGGEELADLRPHLADIYSLGMVFLEALCGQPPAPVGIPADRNSNARAGPLKSAALGIALARCANAQGWIKSALVSAGYPAASGLESILVRCLDTNPLARYRRGWELAQDLDRWRSDLPLAFAPEPLLSQQLPRWLRRRRRLLSSLCAAVVVCMSGTIGATLWSNRILQKLPLLKYERYLDDPADYRFRRPRISLKIGPSQPPPASVFTGSDGPRDLTTLARPLRDYGVLTSRNWRLRDDVRLLPAADREDLEIWLMEQAYRYARALLAMSTSRTACDRARLILDHAAGSMAITAFEDIRFRLGAKPESGAASPAPDRAETALRISPSSAAPIWVDEYLLGVAAEYEVEPVAAASRALDHYDNMLVHRPKSYWGHYRAAAMSYCLGRNANAATHLTCCLTRRPENATVRGQRAACLSLLNRFDEALRECDQALQGAPDLPGLFQNRAFIRAISGKTDGIAEDIESFELLSQILPRPFWGRRSGLTGGTPGEVPLPALALAEAGGQGAQAAGWMTETEARPGVPELEADELNARLAIARKIQEAGDIDLASVEFSKVLLFDPGHLAARMEKALLAIRRGRFNEASRDIDRVLAHPGLDAYLAEHSDFINGLYSAANEFLIQGKVAEGRAVARRALDLAIRAKLSRGNCHFILARAYAMSSSTNPDLVEEAAKQLQHAFKAKHDYYRPFYETDPTFDPVRTKIDSYLSLESTSIPSSAAARPR